MQALQPGSGIQDAGDRMVLERLFRRLTALNLMESSREGGCGVLCYSRAW